MFCWSQCWSSLLTEQKNWINYSTMEYDIPFQINDTFRRSMASNPAIIITFETKRHQKYEIHVFEMNSKPSKMKKKYASWH